MSIRPFSSDKELVKFARKFFRDRVGSFRKDVEICLTANADRDHAYFPALITCIGFVDLLSGLYAGKLKGHGLNDLKSYAEKFMDAKKYDPLRIDILYLTFRHKIAHLSVPYVVFDTKDIELADHKRRRITWRVNAGKGSVPIKLIDHPIPKLLKKTLRPWAVSYDCRAIISVHTFQIDIVKSIYGPRGYLQYLQSELTAREDFANCMRVLFPPHES